MLFKILGLFTVFAVCSTGGLYKAALLKNRTQRLLVFVKAIDDMAQRIKTQGYEADTLLSVCFENPIAYTKNGNIEFSKEFLEKEDIELLNEFFSGFGMRDIEGEYERTLLYVELLRKNCSDAESQCSKLGRLYSTLGVLVGIFVCIFLL